MSRAARKLAAGCALVAALAWGSAFAGSAARTRPSGGSRPSGGHASGSASHGGSRGSAPAHASGRATYGYGGGSVVIGYPGYGYWYGGGYPWYSGYYPYWWWGGPYSAWGVWGWPGSYAVPVGSSDLAYEIPAAITTDISPGKATLRLDGEDVGRAKDYRGTWNQLYVSPGTHVLELEADGYQTLRVTVDAQAGRSYRIAQQLQKGSGMDPRSAELPPPAAEGAGAPSASQTSAPGAGLRTGRLRLDVVPEDAAVYLDGEFLGSGREIAKLHGALPVAAGEHTIDLVRPGYERKSFQIDVPSGESQPFRLELSAEGRD
jgi:hypothetical protein